MKLKTAVTNVKLALVVLVASSTSAFAQSAGDNVVSVGWFHIAPQDSSTPLQITSPISQTVAGSGATVEDSDTLGFSIEHYFTDNWAAAFDLGVPPTYKLNGTGTLSGVGRIGQAKQWAPAILGKYHFGEAKAKIRPWVGFGYSRVSYTDIEISSTFQQEIGRTFGNPAAVTTASLNSSWSPVFNVGLSYALTDRWSANLSVSYLKMKTTGNLTTNTNNLFSPVQSTTTITINPIVTYLHVGYRF